MAKVRKVTVLTWDRFKESPRKYALNVRHYGRPYVIEGHGILVPTVRADELCTVFGMDFEELRERRMNLPTDLEACWAELQEDGFAVVGEENPPGGGTGDLCSWFTDGMAVTMIEEGNPRWSRGFEWTPGLNDQVAASHALDGVE